MSTTSDQVNGLADLVHRLILLGYEDAAGDTASKLVRFCRKRGLLDELEDA
jgi:hypothetical protein